MRTPLESPFVMAVGPHRFYDLAWPNPEIFTVQDVARALACVNRFNGWAGEYSVAAHSVIGAQILEREGASADLVKEFLLHDAHECVIGEMGSPVKRVLRDVYQCDAWERFERAHRIAFAKRFGLPLDVSPEVKAMDLRMLRAEAWELFATAPRRWALGDHAADGFPVTDVNEETLEKFGVIPGFYEFEALARHLGVS